MKAAADRWNLFRAQAILALQSMGPDAALAVPLLNQLVNDKDGSVRAAAVAALASVAAPGQQSIDAVLKMLEDSDSRVRQDAARTAGDYGPSAKSALPQLAHLLSDNDSQVQQLSAIAIYRIGPTSEEVVNALIKVLERSSGGLSDDLTKSWAAKALGESGSFGPKVVPVLIKALQDSSPFVRIEAIGALNEIGLNDPAVVAKIRQMATQDTSKPVQFEAKNVLKLLKS